MEILLFWRLSAAIEDHFSAVGFPAHAILLSLFAAAALFALRHQERAGFGAIEQRLTDLMVRARALILAPTHP